MKPDVRYWVCMIGSVPVIQIIASREDPVSKDIYTGWGSSASYEKAENYVMVLKGYLNRTGRRKQPSALKDVDLESFN